MAFEAHHPEFIFRSTRDWVRDDDSNDDRLVLVCPQTQTTMTLTLTPYDIPASEWEALARSHLAARKKAHLDSLLALGAPADTVLSFDIENVAPNPLGTGWEITYEGMHPGQSFFGYLGCISSRKLLNLFVDTRISYAPGRRDMFREVVANLQITWP